MKRICMIQTNKTKKKRERKITLNNEHALDWKEWADISAKCTDNQAD